jgi:hypothetical protein
MTETSSKSSNTIRPDNSPGSIGVPVDTGTLPVWTIRVGRGEPPVDPAAEELAEDETAAEAEAKGLAVPVEPPQLTSEIARTALAADRNDITTALHRPPGCGSRAFTVD